MRRYLVKPTYLHDQNGKKYSVEELLCDGNHTSSGGSSNLDSTQLKALETRVTTLESTNGAINERFNEVETTSNDAKRTAEIAHNVASEVAEGFDMLNSMAGNAETLAVEAKSLSSSLAQSYESLQTRVSNLEEMDGQASVPNVGKSTMGYTTDFTEYAGSGSGNTLYVEWGDEGRSIGFSDESLLGDVLEEIIYYTTAGISANYSKIQTLENTISSGGTSSGGSTEIALLQTTLTLVKNQANTNKTDISNLDTRVTALENGSSGGGDSGNCLEQNLTLKPYEQLSQEADLAWTDVNTANTDTKTINEWISTAVKTANEALGETKNNLNKIQAINAGSSSDGTLYMIGKINAAKNMYNKYEFTQPEVTASYAMTDILATIDSNNSTFASVIEDNLTRIDTLETKASSQTNSITSLETRMTDAETTLNGLKVSNSNCNCDVSGLQADCQELSNYTTSNFSNVYSKLNELRTQLIKDLDYIWEQMRALHGELPEMNTNAANAWNVSNVTLEF